MKLSAILAAVSPFLATDAAVLPKVTAELDKLIAADKKARDESESAAAEKKAEDKKARDSKRAADKKARDEKREAEDKARDAEWKAEDEELDPEVVDELPEPPVGGAKKPAETNVKEGGKDKAMDAASVAALIAANDAKHVAAREVESILGVVSYDSADLYYKAALDKLGVATDGVHASAFPALLAMAKDKASASSASSAIGGDSAAAADMVKNIPGLTRLRK